MTNLSARSYCLNKEVSPFWLSLAQKLILASHKPATLVFRQALKCKTRTISQNGCIPRHVCLWDNPAKRLSFQQVGRYVLPPHPSARHCAHRLVSSQYYVGQHLVQPRYLIQKRQTAVSQRKSPQRGWPLGHQHAAFPDFAFSYLAGQRICLVPNRLILVAQPIKHILLCTDS